MYRIVKSAMTFKRIFKTIKHYNFFNFVGFSSELCRNDLADSVGY